MSQLVDYDLDKTEWSDSSGQPSRRPRGPLIAGVLVVVLIAAAAFWYLRRGTSEETAAAPSAAPEAAPTAVADAAEPINLPPLDQTDAIVRQLVGALSSHPRVAAWMATNGLIRNFTVVVENISNGQTPAVHLRVLRPEGSFRVIARANRLVIDPTTYRRYDALAGAVGSIDAQGAARLYAQLKPRIQEAYAELGYQQSFDIALTRAIDTLLQAPVVDGEVALEPEGAVEYRYADGRIEGLNDAQKLLVRMGPANARVIQGKLRAIAGAIGLPIQR